MENNKRKCPQCGTEMVETYEKPALNFTCPKCGFQIASSRWDDIDLDDTCYEINLLPIKSPTIEEIKFISNQTGINYLKCKELLIEGGVLFTGTANETKARKEILESKHFKIKIVPDFSY